MLAITVWLMVPHIAGDLREEGDKDAGIDKEMSMWWWSRGYPDPGYIGMKYARAWDQALAMRNFPDDRDPRQAAGGSSTPGTVNYVGNWTPIGPSQNIGGRILSIAIDPSNSNHLFIGSASGGIWTSTDGGVSWHAIATGYPVLGVSSIIINPATPTTLFAGTGEIYRLDSVPANPNPNNTGFNVWKTRGTYGVGILKSTDGGASWSQVFAKNEANMFGIQRLKFNPLNPKSVFACATDGLYRSTDGGATWNRILVKAYVSDIVINAKDTTQLVVGIGNLQNTDKGIYRSTNNGGAWSKITAGLPAVFQGFIRLDNVPSSGNRDTIIASIGVDETGFANELYRSADFGATWTALSNSTHAQWQYWCAHTVAINPSNTSSLIFAGVSVYSYNIAGSSSGQIATNVHSDVHDIRFDPSNNNIVYITCDGGVYKSTDGGASFSQINNGLQAVQFYSSIGYSLTSNIDVGGLQDNGVVIYNGSTWSTFPGLGGTDGAACAISATNANTILASGDAREVHLSTNGGASSSTVLSYWGSVGDSRTAFVAPLAISASNNQIMYVATDNLHKSTNGGTSWTGSALGAGSPATTPNNFIDKIHKTGIALAVSATNPNKVYVSVSPFAQYDNDVDNLYYTPAANVLRTTTGNTPFTSIMGTAPNNLPDRYVMDFAISPTNDDSVWAVVGGFGTPHVYVTADGGLNWKPRDPGPSGGGLPDVPTNAIMYDPKDPRIMYVGNDLGVYLSTNGGSSWQDFNGGLWDATMVVDLVPAPGGKLRAATHGKGMFESVLYSIPLPVNLISFTGLDQDDHIRLSWLTSGESNLKQYQVERSTDGTTFTPIASLTPQGGPEQHAYQYNDYDRDMLAAQGQTHLLYRLQSIDLDGKSSYSNIVAINLTAAGGNITILGTTFTNTIRIQILSDIQQTAFVRLFDMSGRLLQNASYSIGSGASQIDMTGLSYLPRGIYLISVRTRQQQFTKKVMRIP